jgi:RNA polymerase sigma-70 factor (ECF subfamily)
MSDPFAEALAVHRAELLRHCYRMLGSFQEAEEAVQEALLNAWKGRASYSGAAPLRHWLFRITTHVCLNERKARRRRELPGSTQPPARSPTDIGEQTEPELWVTPAPDAALYPGGVPTPTEGVIEERESVALAFVALLQRLPPRQRAVLLLKDVVGFSSEEIAQALDFSLGAVSSALHRARAALPLPAESGSEPAPELLREYVRCWESRDLDALLTLLRDDVALTMPPFAAWFQGRDAVAAFFRSERFSLFWSSGLRVALTRANAQPALIFYRDQGQTRHSIQLPRFQGRQVSSICNPIGPAYLHGFDAPDTLREQFWSPASSS